MSSAPGPPLGQYMVLVPIEISDIPFILGYLLNFGLLGALSIQVFIYATRFRRDSICLQSTVFSVFFIEVLNSVLVLYSTILGANIRCLSCLVTGQRDYILNGVPVSETLSTWAFQALCVLTGISSSIVQAFFAWRIWILGNSVWIPIVVIVISLAQCIMLSTGGILSRTEPNLGVFDTDGAVIWLIISAVCDILITVCTAHLLFRSGGECSYQATQSLVRKLIKMTIETGLVTVIATLLEFAIAQKLNIAHHGVFYFLSKLYANCLLATLNARLAVYNEAKHDPSIAGCFAPTSVEPSDIQFTSTDSFGQGSYGLGLGLGLGSHKVLPVTPTVAQDPSSTSSTRRYRTVGVQSDTYSGTITGRGMKKDVQAEVVWSSVETVSISVSESSGCVVRSRQPSASHSTSFLGSSLEYECDWEVNQALDAFHP